MGVQMLMCEVSKSVKESLQSSVGCVIAASFHALVCAQSYGGPGADWTSPGHVTQQVPANSLLQQTTADLQAAAAAGSAEMSTFKAATSSSIAIQRMSLPNRFISLAFSDSGICLNSTISVALKTCVKPGF